MIPLVDLMAAHLEVQQEVEIGFKRVMTTSAYIGGEEVASFEREYAAFTGVPHCVGVANGTDALELALRAAGVGAGDEVILPANTFVATAEAVARIGARCVLVDVDPDTYLIDVEAALAAVGGGTRAVVPVHLYGQIAPVERLLEGLAGSDIRVVEDAAQSQGATRHGFQAGSAGLGGPHAIASTSFYPGKNLGAYGDAGAVTSADESMATLVRTIGSHGGLTRYVHDVVGVNSRLDGLQAVVLRAKLTRLAGWNEARRAAAARYDELLADMDVVRPVTAEGNVHVWHLYVVRVPGASAARRQAIVAHLNANGVGAAIHYPTPVHRTGAFASLAYRAGAFGIAERTADEIVSLPLFPHITADQQEAVASALRAALRDTTE